MALTRRSINFLFSGIVVCLAAVAAFSIYINSGRPAVQAPSVQNTSISESSGSSSDQVMADKLAALEDMILRDPRNAQTRAQLGNLYYDLGEYQKAIDAYQESLKLQPNDPNVETDEATCYHYLGQNAKSLEILDKVLGYHPNFPQALFNKGIVLIEGNNNIQDGIAVWENLLRTDPDFAQKVGLENKLSQMRSSGK
jgi:cytochrome c-type biogenesis protein CcmH/NrfG